MWKLNFSKFLDLIATKRQKHVLNHCQPDAVELINVASPLFEWKTLSPVSAYGGCRHQISELIRVCVGFQFFKGLLYF